MHDGDGCYLAQFFSSFDLTLFYIFHNWLGAAVVQQARLESMVEREITFFYF